MAVRAAGSVELSAGLVRQSIALRAPKSVMFICPSSAAFGVMMPRHRCLNSEAALWQGSQSSSIICSGDGPYVCCASAWNMSISTSWVCGTPR